MGPERKLYQKVKKSFSNFSLIRLENHSLHGTPDLLVSNARGHFFTIELKVTKGNKVKFSPHQIAFHVKHPRNSFILVQHLGSGCLKLFPGSGVLALEACGLKLEALATGLDACSLLLEARTRCTLSIARRLSLANDLIQFITLA